MKFTTLIPVRFNDGRKVPLHQRIYMVGLSNGGMLAYRYAAERTVRLAACAVVAGAIDSRIDSADPVWTLPVPDRPLPMLILHGDADPTVPYDGGAPTDRWEFLRRHQTD